MKKMMIRTIALTTAVLCILMLNGCKVVYGDEMVLLNPTESAVATTTSADESTESTGDVQTDVTDATGSTGIGGSTAKPGATTTKAQQSTAKNVEKKLSGKLEIQCFTNESKIQNQYYTDLFTAFEKATGVSVTAHVGSQVNQRLSKRWINGNPPDFAFLSGSGIPDIALEESGALYDCTDLIKNGYVYGADEKIWDVVKHDYFEVSDGGKFYRPGIGGSTYGLFYDETYVKQIGVTLPTNYTELMAFCKTMTAKNVAVFTTNGSTGNYARWSFVMPALAAYGQDFFDEICKGTKAAWGDARTKSVLQRWYDLCRMDGVMLTGTASFDHTTSQMKWLNHNCVFVGSGTWIPWEMGSAIPSSFKMQYLASPLILDSQTPTVAVQPGRVIIAKDAKNLENAKAFLRYLYREDVTAEGIAILGEIPVRNDMGNTSGSISDANLKRFAQYFESGKVNFVIKTYDWGELDTALTTLTHSLMTGGDTVDSALATMLSKTTK